LHKSFRQIDSNTVKGLARIMEKKRCFVIMPFSQTSDKHTEKYWAEQYQHFLKPLIEESQQLEAHRSEPLHGDIVKQIITDLIVSPVVVADLTDLNPNVFWELGVRQSFKHSTITIAIEGTKLPFDIFSKGTLFYYPEDHIKNLQFCTDFKEAITSCLANPTNPDSAVLEAISGRGSLYEIMHDGELIRRLDALDQEQEWNEMVLKVIYDKIKSDKGRPKQDQTYPTARLVSAANDLLITERYLDESPDFYSAMAVCTYSIHQINDLLKGWNTNPKSTQEYFENNEETYRKCLKIHREKLATARQKLSRKLFFV
jgi:hypothetical protein